MIFWRRLRFGYERDLDERAHAIALRSYRDALIAACVVIVAINLQTWLAVSQRVNARALLGAEGLVGIALGALVTLLGLARTWGWPLPDGWRGSAASARIAWRLAVVGGVIIAMGVYMVWPL